MAHHPVTESHPASSSIWASKPGYKPKLLFFASLAFIALVVIPPPQSMVDLASKLSPPGYSLSAGCKTITDNINKRLHPEAFAGAKKAETKEVSKTKSLLDAG
jgi:sodium-dependent dicarboxylate transporter 2/3/5